MSRKGSNALILPCIAETGYVTPSLSNSQAPRGGCNGQAWRVSHIFGRERASVQEVTLPHVPRVCAFPSSPQACLSVQGDDIQHTRSRHSPTSNQTDAHLWICASDLAFHIRDTSAHSAHTASTLKDGQQSPARRSTRRRSLCAIQTGVAGYVVSR